MATEQQQKVKLEAHAGEEQIPADQARKDLPVLVKVVAPPKKERAPIDLVALLDVSGSMAWKAKDPNWTRLQLVSAAMQLAMRRLGAADRLAVVPFNHDVARPTALMRMDNRGQVDAQQKVIHLRAGGDTKFLPALNYAKRLLDARSDEEKKTRPGFVFLLSDGEDRSGIVHRHVDVGYPVHTFGMCQRCSPQAMLHVARQTKGTFHPIDDDVRNVALALGNFVGGITSVVAVNTRVSFKVPDGSAVRITSIDSGAYDRNWAQGTGGYIHVGVMCADEAKKFIVHLSVPALDHGKAAAAAGVDDQQELLLTVSGAYNKPDGRKVEAMDEQHVKVKRTRSPAAPAPAPAAGAPPPHPQHGVTTICIQEVVAVQIVQVQVASIVQGVVDAHVVDGKPIDQKLMADELDKRWASFKAKEKSVAGPGHVVDGGEKVVRELARLLREEEDNITGVLYAHSWLACHATQQVTTFAVSGKVESWFHMSYMALVAEDLVYNASSMVTSPPGGGAGDGDDPCKCVDFDRIDQRLELWSKVKREVPDFFQPSEVAESHHLTAVIREASLDAINRAMHQDMYLAVVHASNLRRCYCAGNKQPQHQQQHDVTTKPKDQ